MSIETDIRSLELESEFIYIYILNLLSTNCMLYIVSTVEQSIESMRRQHDVLSVEKSLSSISEIQQQIITEHEIDESQMDLNKLYNEKLHRMTGITAFRVKQNRAFGIRIELFSNGHFLSPHYMIIRKNLKGLLEVYRHTIPAFIPLAKYQQDYLNVNMRLFVKKIRQALMNNLEKQNMFLENLTHVKNVEVDPDFRLVKLHLDPKGIAYLVCDNDQIKRAVVKDYSDDNQKEENLERLLLGPLNQLNERLEKIS